MRIAERLAADAYADYVNPQWVKLLRLLEMNVSYEQCAGAELFTVDGRRILDFGPLLPETVSVPFGDIAALEQQLATKGYAAFFVEPIQAEGGIRVPDENYLRAAQDLCQRYGSLLVADEVQTGMFRTGPFLA